MCDVADAIAEQQCLGRFNVRPWNKIALSMEESHEQSREPLYVARQKKTLQLRHARFQGPLAPPRNFTPPSAAHDELVTCGAAETASSSWAGQQGPLDALDRGCPEENDILQEISNASMRRRRRAPDEPKSPTDRRSSSASYQTSMFGSNSSEILDNRSSNPRPRSGFRRQSKAPARASMPRRSTSSETPKYIESLETNIASLQAQLQAFTSPTSTDTSRAKHRALRSEIRTLRQDVQGWENSFTERVQEQQERLAENNEYLKGRVRMLERDLKVHEERSQGLEIEVERKSIALQAAEEANFDLEQRLEFMSELVATSPGKPSWHADTLRTSRRKSMAPSCTGTPRNNLRHSLISPDRFRSPDLRKMTELTPMQPLSRRDSLASSGPSRDSGYSTERTSELAFGDSVINGHDITLSRPVSWSRGPPPELEQKARGGKRGRKFYPGSAVQSLILPSTQQYVDQPTSAPILRNPAPFLRTPILPRVVSPESSEAHGEPAPETSPASTLEPKDPNLRSVESSQTTPRMPLPCPSPSVSPLPDTLSDDGDATEFIHNLSLTHDYGDTVRSLFEELQRPRDGVEEIQHKPIKSTQEVDIIASRPISIPTSCPDVAETRTIACAQSAVKQATQDLAVPAETASYHARTTMRYRLRRLLTFFSTSIETHSLNARKLFGSTWDGFTVSKHVLEFRCWLIRILIGRLRIKGLFSHLPRRAASRPISTTGAGLGLGLSLVPLNGAAGTIVDAQTNATDDTEEYLLKALEDEGRHIPPFAPPMNWARFSMTLICAVGIAIKDGPASLFGPGTDVQRRDSDAQAWEDIDEVP